MNELDLLKAENKRLQEEIDRMLQINGWHELVEYRLKYARENLEKELRQEFQNRWNGSLRQLQATKDRAVVAHEIHGELNYDKVLRHSVNYEAVRWEDLPWSNVVKRIEKMQNLIRRLHTCCKP